jgi:hypothetical protein
VLTEPPPRGELRPIGGHVLSTTAVPLGVARSPAPPVLPVPPVRQHLVGDVGRADAGHLDVVIGGATSATPAPTTFAPDGSAEARRRGSRIRDLDRSGAHGLLQFALDPSCGYAPSVELSFAATSVNGGDQPTIGASSNQRARRIGHNDQSPRDSGSPGRATAPADSVAGSQPVPGRRYFPLERGAAGARPYAAGSSRCCTACTR